MKTESFRFESRDGTLLQGSLECPSEAKVAVGIVHGYGDHQGRYADFRRHCGERGLATLAFDYRGHGLSAGRRQSCSRWQDYLDDLTAFWQQAQQRCRGLPLFLLGHSHGGLMVSVFASQAPEGLRGAILVSPYWKLGLPAVAWKRMLLRSLHVLFPHLSLKTEIQLSQLSRDVGWQEAAAADPLFGRAVTPRWFVETQRMHSTLSEVAASVVLPCLLLVGEADEVAAPAAMQLFFEELASKDKAVQHFVHMRHELLGEQDRQIVFHCICEWILGRL